MKLDKIMKNIFRFKNMFWQMTMVFILAYIQIASCQTPKDQASAIPENINKILKASCLGCHGSDGRLLALAKLNLSKWAEFTADEKVNKAAGMCYEITEGKMPPKSARKSNPEMIPSAEQIKLVCNWAESLKPKAEGK